jgi:hypothetical protein
MSSARSHSVRQSEMTEWAFCIGIMAICILCMFESLPWRVFRDYAGSCITAGFTTNEGDELQSNVTHAAVLHGDGRDLAAVNQGYGIDVS